ncbi:MAG: PEP-CTERM sorting domain-containing protein [Leptolyngbyaceae cyanobacterium bins.349]|nr:PEP-CTERM sorting domain-containing protein [Leptolyngbyaceae cyanobacterium bins.349]
MKCQSPTSSRSVLLGSVGSLLIGTVATFGVDVAPAPAFNLISSTADFNITFTDPTFADANIAYTQFGGLQGLPGDSLDFRVRLLPSAQNYAFAANGNITSQLVAQVGTVYTYNLVSTGGLSEYQYRYDIPIATTPGLRFLEDNRWKLEFALNPVASDFAFQNTIFNLSVLISGNWSTLGTNPGQVEFLGINPNYAIANFFVYNPQTDQTLFSINSSNWDGTSANVGFILNGPSDDATAVPEPATLIGVALAGAGLSVLKAKQSPK